jgi:phosphoenolpyruvate synthase/pyruvate phosphate dikinase
MIKDRLNELLNDKWYVQSGNLTPVYLMVAWFSGFEMKKYIGAAYSAGLFTSQNEAGDLYYRMSDLQRLYDFAFSEWQKDNDYFKKVRDMHAELQKPHQKTHLEIDNANLAYLSDKILYQYIYKAMNAVTDSVGPGHVIEALAIPSDEKLKNALAFFARDARELNEAFVVLTTPETHSFAQEAEDDLRLIGKLNKSEREEAIKVYITKWGWMRNSYAGRKKMTRDEIAGEANAVSRMKLEARINTRDKDYWIKELKLPEKLVERFRILTFVTDWQDERKKYILQAVDRLETLLEELSHRTEIPINDLRYGLPPDFDELLPRRAKELAKRRAGVCVVAVPEETIILTGSDYKTAVAVLTKGHSHEGDELRGLVASLGTVRGPVKVCVTLESLEKVEEGDILVASMTRPEYLPAMKKAAAFVTDEGGITCHAAIVAREMGKPCVIGTKVATKVLKDGDLVEVKGNHGVVIIKERVTKNSN